MGLATGLATFSMKSPMGLPTFLDRKVASPKGLAISLVKSGQSDETGHFYDDQVASPVGLATPHNLWSQPCLETFS